MLQHCQQCRYICCNTVNSADTYIATLSTVQIRMLQHCQQCRYVCCNTVNSADIYPPRSKKFSCTSMAFSFNTLHQMAASLRSIGVNSESSRLSELTSPVTDILARAFLSSFPDDSSIGRLKQVQLVGL